ncbi:MAG: sugar transferase [Lachnospiraceae bacterium]|nr:sugar transferase [Lachnospiraceae bacterium]
MLRPQLPGCCIFGLIPEHNLERDGRIRHSLGFYGVTATAVYMCFVVLLLMFLKSGNLHWPEYLLIAFVSLVNLWLVDGRIAMVSMITATMGTVICSICEKKQWKLSEKIMRGFRLIMCFSYLIIGGIYFILVVTYRKDRWEGIRKLSLMGILERRVAVPNRLMQRKQTFRMFIITITAVFFTVQKGMLNPGNAIFPLLLAAWIPADRVDSIGEAWAEIIDVGKRDENDVLPRAYEGIDMWEVYRKKPLSYKIAKRLIDIVEASVAMILLLPVFNVTAIAIKLQDGGAAVYSGKRYGKDLKYFPMHKFRSMCLDADKKVGAVITDEDKNGLAFKIKDDPRITKVGHFIRKTSIDELPQFWNVLMGEMSLMGPRPIQTTDKEIEPYEKQRWAVKPGITCIWQVAGCALVPWDEWVELDLKYISEMSLRTDFKLMVITIVALWRKDGAY